MKHLYIIEGQVDELNGRDFYYPVKLMFCKDIRSMEGIGALNPVFSMEHQIDRAIPGGEVYRLL